MALFKITIFAGDNVINPQNPGFLPAEDKSYRSDLQKGDTLTWTGGGQSTTVTIEDNRDAVFDEARSDQKLGEDASFDGLSHAAGQTVTPTYTLELSGDDGQTYTMTSFNFSANTNGEVPDAVFFEGAVPPDGTVLTLVKEINPTGKNSREYEDFVVCFCAGTRIRTPEGARPVEALRAGDLVLTEGGEAKPILHVCCRRVSAEERARNPRLHPVKIGVGALGRGLPLRDLWVSRQHRLKLSSPIAARMFGVGDVLIAATHLTALPGVRIDTGVGELAYYHVLLATHEILLAEGAPAESLYLGQHAARALTPAAREEIKMLYPALMARAGEQASAHVIPPGARQRRLLARHAKNGKPVLG